MRIFNLLFLTILFNNGIIGQIPYMDTIYGQSSDEVIHDAVILSSGEVLMVGKKNIDTMSQPLALIVDDSLNIRNISERFSKANLGLIYIAQWEKNIYIFGTQRYKENKIYMFKLDMNANVISTDSLSLPGSFVNLRNHESLGEQLYIVGDFLPDSFKMPTACILSIDESNGTINFKKLKSGKKAPAYGFDIHCNNDSTFILLSTGIVPTGKALSLELSYFNKNFTFIKGYHFPFDFFSNAKFLKLNEHQFLVNGRIRVPRGARTDLQLFSGIFNINNDSISLEDSIQIGRLYVDEQEGLRSSEITGNNIFFGGTSGFDAESYPFSAFENNFIISRFDRNLNRRFTRYFSLRNHNLTLYKCILTNSSRSILLVGTAYNFKNETNERQRDIYIVKLDSSGNIATGLPPEILPENDFLLYPNPGTNYLQVSLPNASSGRFALYDMQGRLIEWQLFRQHLQINTAGLPAGIYIYRISDEKERTHYGKWVKQ